MRSEDLQGSRPNDRSRSSTEGPRTFEPAQQKKDFPANGQLTSRYSAVILQQERSDIQNISNQNSNFSFNTICYIIEIISYSKKLNSIENNQNVFQFDNVDLNKFWLKYFGVVNLSDHKCTF